jgi:hypothetical protein
MLREVIRKLEELDKKDTVVGMMVIREDLQQ